MDVGPQRTSAVFCMSLQLLVGQDQSCSQHNELHGLICVARCASVWGPGLSCLKAASNESRDPKRKHGHKERRPSMMALHHCKSYSVSVSILAVRIGHVYLQPDELDLGGLEDLELFTPG